MLKDDFNETIGNKETLSGSQVALTRSDMASTGKVNNPYYKDNANVSEMPELAKGENPLYEDKSSLSNNSLSGADTKVARTAARKAAKQAKKAAKKTN